MKLRYSPRALGDLAAISDYLIERSPAGARAVEETIRTTVRMLEQFPRAAEHYNNVPTCESCRRRVFHSSSSIRRGLVILHIRHAARAPLTTDDL
jgi:plasmid stabilization system protein ParE